MRFTKTNIKNLITVSLAALAVSAISVRADFNPPGQVPPAGNVSAPVYSTGAGQTLTGSLEVTASSGAALVGSSVGYGLQGIVTTDAGGGDAALYGYAFGADATDYAGVFYGGLGVQLASGDIYYLNRNSGISWPRVLDEAALYGVSVTTSGELRLLGHGAGINFLNQSVSSLLTVSEAGVVNIAAGGALRVNNVDVCLSNGTNCPAGTTPNLQTVTNAGNTTTQSITVSGLSASNGRITSVATPTAGTDAANKSYVDAAVAGSGAADIKKASCNGTSLCPGDCNQFAYCTASCPSGYEIIDTSVNCLDPWGFYLGEGGYSNATGWTCAKLVAGGGSTSFAEFLFKHKSLPGSYNIQVYGIARCIYTGNQSN